MAREKILLVEREANTRFRVWLFGKDAGCGNTAYAGRLLGERRLREANVDLSCVVWNALGSQASLVTPKREAAA